MTALLQRLVRFQQPEKALGYLGPLEESRIAALFGLSPDEYLTLCRGFEDQVRDVAQALLTRPGFAEAVDRLPFTSGQHIVAPSTVDEKRAGEYPHFQRAGISWENKDINPISDFLRVQPDLTVEPRLDTSRANLRLDDGVHLSIEGQQEVVVALVQAIVTVT